MLRFRTSRIPTKGTNWTTFWIKSIVWNLHAIVTHRILDIFSLSGCGRSGKHRFFFEGSFSRKNVSTETLKKEFNNVDMKKMSFNFQKSRSWTLCILRNLLGQNFLKYFYKYIYLFGFCANFFEFQQKFHGRLSRLHSTCIEDHFDKNWFLKIYFFHTSSRNFPDCWQKTSLSLSKLHSTCSDKHFGRKKVRKIRVFQQRISNYERNKFSSVVKTAFYVPTGSFRGSKIPFYTWPWSRGIGRFPPQEVYILR